VARATNRKTINRITAPIKALMIAAIMTTLLGIVGAFVATYLGQAVGWYHAGEGAGFIGAIVGAIIVLVVWGMIAPRLERT
jgi:uncharacterized membrane protein YeaQ/YmgE (transglycosylase-associated protein family)